MARKVEKASQPSAGDSPALDALDSLRTESKATIAGRELVFREYAALEGYQVAYEARDFIADLLAEMKGGRFRYAAVRRLYGPHLDVVVRIAAQSADVDEAFVRGLSRNDLEQFLAGWFAANAGFFVNEVLVELREGMALTALNSTASSSGSVAPGSGTSATSSDSPSVN